MAQKKELSQARSSIKSGRYDDAERTLTNLLKDSTNRANKRIWLAYYDAVRGKYEQGNEKLYFVYESKGTDNVQELRGIEKHKIDCAKKHFKAISGDDVIYDWVDTYERLMDIVKK